MPTLANVTVFCFLASYFVALVLESARLLRGPSVSRMFPLLAGTAGLVAHTAYLIVRSGLSNLPPLLSSTHDWLLVLAWIAIVFYLFLTILDRKLSVGLFTLPLVLILVSVAYLVSSEPNAVIASDSEMVEAADRGWAMLHASLLVFGMAGVLIGLVLGMMYLVQHRRLKHKHAGRQGLMLPSLEKLARLNWWSVILSFPLLTLGMATGVILGLMSRSSPEPVTFNDPIVITSGIVWLVMVVFFVWLLQTHRPVGKQIAWMTIWAFGFLLVTLIGLQILIGGGTFSLESWHTSLPGTDPFNGSMLFLQEQCSQ
jgi:ABC-type transport system involved in cytochrome c biogenesis permease subunit